MAKSSKRPLAVLKLTKYLKIGDFLLWVAGIIQNIKNNPLVFVTPNPSITIMETNLAELEKAEVKVKSRAPGASAARDVIYSEVVDDMRALLSYVQNLADDSADEQTAIAIIEASGFDLKVNGSKAKAPLSVKNTENSGTIKLTAKADEKRATYYWQMSYDNDGNWQDLPDTLKSSTTVSGLKPGSRMFCRTSYLSKKKTTPWSTPVSVIVL